MPTASAAAATLTTEEKVIEDNTLEVIAANRAMLELLHQLTRLIPPMH